MGQIYGRKKVEIFWNSLRFCGLAKVKVQKKNRNVRTSSFLLRSLWSRWRFASVLMDCCAVVLCYHVCCLLSDTHCILPFSSCFIVSWHSRCIYLHPHSEKAKVFAIPPPIRLKKKEVPEFSVLSKEPNGKFIFFPVPLLLRKSPQAIPLRSLWIFNLNFMLSQFLCKVGIGSFRNFCSV